jgi:AraC family transcriptional regulator
MTHALESRVLGDFRMVESLYPARLRQPRHSHALASFSFVLAGTYLETFGVRPAKRQPSTLVFHPPQESHAVEYQDRSVRILSVQMNPQRFSHFTSHSAIFESRATARTQTINWIGHRLYREFREADDLSVLAIEGLVYEALVEAARAHPWRENPAPPWLRQAEDFLRDNFSQPFRFEAVARAAGVHPAHLARVFRRNHDCTVGEYVRRLRVNFAVHAMGNRAASLAEVASAAGFSDQSHLTRTFRAHFGMTPSEYRRIHLPWFHQR